MNKTRKRYSSEVKLQAALRLLKGEASTVEIAKEIGCHPTIIAEWKERLLANAPKIFESAAAEDDKARHIAKLERLIGKLTVQNDFLEKVLTNLDQP
jgi:transposase-like protein